MKRFLYLIIIIISFNACDCESENYQIKEIVELIDEPTQCRYRADALTPCGVWQNRDQIYFQTDCQTYQLSQVISKSKIDQYTKP